MQNDSILVAVDLGSNTFHCQISRILDDHIYPMDSVRESIWLASGLDGENNLTDDFIDKALSCLRKFNERIKGFDKRTVRAVGTNTLRIANNSEHFLKQANKALGFPIEIISGREEARLIFLGVSNRMPQKKKNSENLIIDIGGGSTEIIFGKNLISKKLESIFIGCISITLKYFSKNFFSYEEFLEAELRARKEIQVISYKFKNTPLDNTFGSSGTIKLVGRIINALNISESELSFTKDDLEKLITRLSKIRNLRKINLQDIQQDRLWTLPGGIVILSALFKELKLREIQVVKGALREGIIYDLNGRFSKKDIREITIQQFAKKYHVDIKHAKRVTDLATKLSKGFVSKKRIYNDTKKQHIYWSCMMHEIGVSVSYNGYHKHSAYIINFSDMPGFSRNEQEIISNLIIAHRRSIKKYNKLIKETIDYRTLLCIRIAIIIHRQRRIIRLPQMSLMENKKEFNFKVEKKWLQKKPMTMASLLDEVKEWNKIGFSLKIIETV